MMMHVDIAVEVLGGNDDPRPRFAEVVDHAMSLGRRWRSTNRSRGG